MDDNKIQTTYTEVSLFTVRNIHFTDFPEFWKRSCKGGFLYVVLFCEAWKKWWFIFLICCFPSQCEWSVLMLSESGQRRGWVLASRISGSSLPGGSSTEELGSHAKINCCNSSSSGHSVLSVFPLFSCLTFYCSLWSGCHISLHWQNWAF